MAVDESPVSGSDVEAVATPKITPFTLLAGTIIRPVATFKQLRDAQKGYWWFVLLVTAITIIAVALAESSAAASRVVQFTAVEGGKAGVTTQSGAAPEAPSSSTSRSGAANNGGTGQRGTNGATGARQFQTASPLLLIGAPLVGGIAITLLDYGLRALLIFLMSMLLGGKAAFREVFRMAVWTTLPAAIRRVVQALAVLLTGGQIAAGFSAALSAAEVRTLPIVNLVLGYVDIYTLWSALLLGIGAAITGKLSKGKAAFAVAIYLGVSLVGILVFYAVTSAISGALGGNSPRGAIPGGGRVRLGG